MLTARELKCGGAQALNTAVDEWLKLDKNPTTVKQATEMRASAQVDELQARVIQVHHETR
jgi:hypothetical protein